MEIFRQPLSEIPQGLLEPCIGDSFFASALFAGLWEEKGGAPVVFVARDDDGVAGVIPGVEFGHGFWKRFMSMPDGCYGGVFTDPKHPADQSTTTAELLDAVIARRYLRTFLFDFDGHLPTDDSRFQTMDLVTTLVDIAHPDWVPPDKKIQSQIRKAEREGIELQPMDWAQHGEQFLQLLRMTEVRHQSTCKLPPSFFKRLAEAAQADSRIHWVWCEYQGQGVCSHIYFLERGMLQGWMIIFDKAFSFLKPNQYIRFVTCREMALRGVRLLNLGGTPDNAPGLDYYKRRWGGKDIHYRGFVHKLLV